jgi:hypothetical protein
LIWSLELYAVVGSDGIDDDEPDLVSLKGDRDLISEYVLLTLQVRSLYTEDPVQCWLLLQG